MVDTASRAEPGPATSSSTAATDPGGGLIGASVARVEDGPLVTGRGRYLDNLAFPALVHAVVVRSPFAHARVGAVEVTAARGVEGVLTVLSGSDLAGDWTGPLPMIWPVPGCLVPEHWPLATDEVRYMGDGVAVVVAESLSAAQDAAELVDVEYEPLPVVTEVDAALEDGAPLVHDDLGTNRCFRLAFTNGGDIDRLFEEAEVRLSRTFRQQRVLASPMEPRVAVAEPRAGEYVLWTSTQVPHLIRRTIGSCVGLPEHALRVVAPDVGGGFGAKLNVYAEEALVLALARRLGRPVKWVETRSEHAQATTHGRAQLQRMELAATRDGRVTAVRVSSLASMGAYLQLETPGIPIVGRFLYSGAYQAQAYGYECIGVFTNQTPTGAYRGAGRPEAAYAIERMMDLLAREVGQDPAEIRRRNFLAPGENVDNPAGIPYDSVDYAKTLDRALEAAGYEALREEQARRRASGDRRRLGIGIAFYVDSSGLGPSAVLSFTNYLSGGWEYGHVRMLSTGSVEVLTGSTSQGQGHETAWRQVVAAELGVGPEDVRVLHGDTAVVPMGTGTFGSRSLIVGGTAALLAARKLVAKARRIAAHLLEAEVDDVEFAAGRFSVAGAPDRAVSIQEVAATANLARPLPEGEEPGLQETTVLDPPDWTYPFGAHVAVVEVDTETGRVEIVRYVAVDDCGTVINPMLVDGQVHGGVAQGIGQALYEEAVYDGEGLLLTTSFLEYLIPGPPEVPAVETDRTVTTSPLNPLGAKGVGEAGTLAAPPAVMNAVHDAVDTDEIDMPATPERVWRALRARGGP
jgi:carbon-monoxide dehydrogenase large subunit